MVIPESLRNVSIDELINMIKGKFGNDNSALMKVIQGLQHTVYSATGEQQRQRQQMLDELRGDPDFMTAANDDHDSITTVKGGGARKRRGNFKKSSKKRSNRYSKKYSKRNYKKSRRKSNRKSNRRPRTIKKY